LHFFSSFPKVSLTFFLYLIQLESSTFKQVYPVGAAEKSQRFILSYGTGKLSFFEPLEPRILLSADLIPLPVDADSTVAIVAFDETVLPQVDNSAESAITNSPDEIVESTDSNEPPDPQTTSDEAVDSSPSESAIPLENSDITGTHLASEPEEDINGSLEIIFLNDDIEGFQELAEDLAKRDNSELIILSSTNDGLSQISAALDTADDIKALHFFTHANDSSVKIGGTWINSSTLEQHQDSVSSWGEHLTQGGDILFYGCDLAASNDGTDLLQEISDLTGADVAASDDATGHQSMGGNWVLEYSSGEIETELAVSPTLQSEWLQILAEETIADTFDTASYSNSDGSVAWTTDWIEIGENDGAASGNVLIEDGRLHIVAAGNDESERGISRIVDLSQAASAYVSYDYEGSANDLFAEASFQIRSDSGSSWSTLDDYYFLPASGSVQFDISSYISSTTEVRLVSTGADEGGLSYSSGDLYIDNLHIDYTTDTWSTPLWISTGGDVNDGGQVGLEDWNQADIIGLNNPTLVLGSDTEGEFSMAAQLSTFAEGSDIKGLHYVTTNMFIGSSGFELKQGDLLFTSPNPDEDSFGRLEASKDDVIHFRPATSGDYSAGTFTILFEGIQEDKKIRGITLVEKDVTVGDRDLHAGDLLFIREGGDYHSDVYHYATVDVEPGSGTTSGTVSVLLEGDDININISQQLTGIDLVERTVTIGDTELTEGTILLSVKEDDSINGVDIAQHDIFTLDVTSTSSSDGSTADLGVASASILLDGTDVNFDTNQERIDAISLTVQGDIPEPTFTTVSFNAQDKTITLTGTNLDYLGDIGANVKEQLDWSKITWDINGDGTTTPDITFDITNVSTVLTSPTTLTIHLTGQKTIEITETTGYGEDDGIDTLTILPGFSSNPEGELATTDGLTDAPIATTTAPIGVTLSNTSIPENTDTTSGFIVGTLSTLDADISDTHTYTITGGLDSGLFSIGGSSGDELILTAGVLDYETKSSYTVELTVSDATGQSDSQTHTILVANIDETPIITTNILTISEDQTVTLTSANLAATDEETIDGNLIFTINTLLGGQFEHTDLLGTAITTFSQSDVASGKIIFIDDGDETAPTYSISVHDGDISSLASSAAITFSNINDAPTFTTNSLSISEGQRLTLTTSDLVINDLDNSTNELVFTINSVTAGQFELSTATGTAITSFTQEDLNLGRVEFIHNGGENAPAYTLSLSDGENSIGPSDAVISFISVNDTPVIQRNSLDILQGQTVTITDLQLLATDPDDGAASLTFSITNLVAGEFQLSGSTVTSFTQGDIDSGDVTFVHDNSATPPAFDVTVQDDEAAISKVMAASINFNTVNQAPSFDINSLDLDEGESVSLTSANLSATDFDHGPASLIFTVSGVSQGQFESTDNLGTAVTSFTQADINAGKIIFKHDGGEAGPSYTATVSDGSLSDSLTSTITFAPVNDAPEITTNTITLSEGATVSITASNIGATDVDDTDSSLTFTVSDITGGIFTTTADISTALTSFTQTQISAGDIQFIHNGGEDAPAYLLTVSDGGGLTSPPQAASVFFTGVNDEPQLINNNLNVDEGGTVSISAVNLFASDPESISSTLTFTVENISGGQFERTSSLGDEIVSFSQAEILSGEIIFVHDGEEAAPTYEITVTDDDASPLSTTPSATAITFTSINDIPDLTVNTITLSEGDTISLDSSILAATDSDSSVPDLIFTITDLTAGTFSNINDPEIAITSFTQSQITDGEIRLIHDGGEVALSYTVSVSDGNLTTTAAAATVNFTAINDAPTITVLASDQSFTEDTVHSLSDITIADADSGASYQVSLELSDGSAGLLGTTDFGSATSSFSGGILTIAGTDISDINTVLTSTIFSPSLDYTEDVTITITATDGIDTATALTKTLHPILINDAPSANPLTQSGTYIEDTSYDLDDIVVSDVDEGEILSAQMSLSSPDLGTLSPAGGAIFNTTTGIWTISGTVTEVNSALSLVSFTPSPDSFQDTTIAVQIEDGREDGVAALSGTISLTGTSVADAPIVSDMTTLTSTPSEPIYISSNSADGSEVTHFKITSIENGDLFLIDGVTAVSEDDFITISDGAAGLIFTPTSEENGSFEVTGSADGLTVASESPVSTSTVTISTVTISTDDFAVPEVTSETGSDGGASDTGGDSLGEESTIVEEISGIDETLNLVTGLETGTETAPEPEVSAPDSDDGTTGETEDVSKTESTGEETPDDTLSYVNAKKIGKLSSTIDQYDISAAFDGLTFDMSFESAAVKSFSLSSAPSSLLQNSSVSLAADPEVRAIYSTANYDLLDLEYRERTFEEYQAVRKSLENFREQTEQEASIEKTVVGSAIAASTGLSAGYVIWLLRSGALLSSILSSLPAWQLADPLAVLAGAKGEDEEDDDSIESIIEQGAHQPSPEEKPQPPQEDSRR